MYTAPALMASIIDLLCAVLIGALFHERYIAFPSRNDSLKRGSSRRSQNIVMSASVVAESPPLLNLKRPNDGVDDSATMSSATATNDNSITSATGEAVLLVVNAKKLSANHQDMFAPSPKNNGNIVKVMKMKNNYFFLSIYPFL